MLSIATQKDGVLKTKQKNLSPWRVRVLVNEQRNCVSLTDCPYSREECFMSPYVWETFSDHLNPFVSILTWQNFDFAEATHVACLQWLCTCVQTRTFLALQNELLAHNPWAIKKKSSFYIWKSKDSCLSDMVNLIQCHSYK